MATAPRKRRPNSSPDLVGIAPKPVNRAPVNYGNVAFVRPELEKNLAAYKKIRDCIEGADAVKAEKAVYLPKPNEADTSAANATRFNQYISRAVFYNVTGQTLQGLLGQVFAIDPQIEIPNQIDPIRKDVDGSGTTLIQQSKMSLSYVIAKGRAGLLVDYPTTNGPTTAAQQQSGEVLPTITLYSPEDVINWRVRKVGNRKVLSLVVIREDYAAEDDGFEEKVETQYRVLRLAPPTALDPAGYYYVELWRKGVSGFGPVDAETRIPTDGTGKPLTEIPFMFIGAEDNTVAVNPPPLKALAELNLAHYRNSADYEEHVHIVGQGTPVISGLSQQWVDDVLKGTIELGSRAAILLPEGGSADLLQAQERSAPFEAMEHKENQMLAIGAKLVQAGGTERTATEASINNAAEQSVLTAATNNVSAAYKWALEWAAIFAGAVTVRGDAANDNLIFSLNTEFAVSKMSPDQIRAVIEAWNKGAIVTSEMRERLTKVGLATLDLAKFKTEVEADKPKPGDPDYVETRFDADGEPLPPRNPLPGEDEEGDDE